MSRGACLGRLCAEFALLAKALANPHRLELLDLRVHEAGPGLTDASAHLQVRRRARLVMAEKRGLAREGFPDWRAAG